jgi:uncharacterized membrane protein YfcA
VILFLANQGVQKVVFRASLITYFLFLNMATIPIFFAGGLISRAVLVYAGLFIPTLLVGALAGSKLLHRVPEHLFRVVTLTIVICAGSVAVLSGLGAI